MLVCCVITFCFDVRFLLFCNELTNIVRTRKQANQPKVDGYLEPLTRHAMPTNLQKKNVHNKYKIKINK